MTSVGGRPDRFLGVPIAGEHDAVENGPRRRNASSLVVRGTAVGLGTAAIVGGVGYATNAQFRQVVNSTIGAITAEFHGDSSTDAIKMPTGSGVTPKVETTTTVTSSEMTAEQKQAYADANAWLTNDPNSSIMQRADAITQYASQIGQHTSSGDTWNVVVADPVVTAKGDVNMMLFIKVKQPDGTYKHEIAIVTAGDAKELAAFQLIIENTGSLALDGSGGATNRIDPEPTTPQATVQAVQQYTSGIPIAQVHLTTPVKSSDLVWSTAPAYGKWEQDHAQPTVDLTAYANGQSADRPPFVATTAKDAVNQLFGASQATLPGIRSLLAI